MYNVLLVEDEILERENSRESWIWQGNGFRLVADAGNGEDAWEILQREKIDIVVTDIKMPFMDGLELCRLIQRDMPQIKVIILSGYSEFAYARQAVSLGVSEYIVKPVKSQDLLETLQKVAVKMQAEVQISEEAAQYRNHMHDHLRQKRLRLFEDLSLGIVPVDSLRDQAGLLGIDLGFSTVCCAIISYLEDKVAINEAEHLMILESHQVVDEILADASKAGRPAAGAAPETTTEPESAPAPESAAASESPTIVFNRSLRETCLICRDPELPSVKALLTRIKDGVKARSNTLQRLCEPTISLGAVKPGLAGIAESFAEAHFLLNFRHLVEHQGLLFMDEILPALKSSFSSELTLTTETALVGNMLRLGSRTDVPAVVEKLVQRLQAMNLSFMFFQFTCIEIVNIIRQFLLDIDEDPMVALTAPDGSKDPVMFGNWLNWSNDMGAFRRDLTATLTAIIDIRDRKRKSKYNAVIASARTYIDQHYANPAISLTSVAASVSVNASYFSTLFAQEMGESFIEYLTRIRIEKAKQLLRTTSMRTIDIAFAVGYSDSNYFSKIFRRMTNVSPRDFKNQF